MWFPMRKEPPGYVGPWTFQSVVELPNVSVSEVFAILLDDSAWQHWHPEVTDIQWNGDVRGVGASRTIVFRDRLFMILLAGPVGLAEDFDVWEDTKNVKKFGFCITASTRPVFLSYKAVREEFKVEAITGQEGGSKFTRTITVDPSFAVRYLLGFIVKPYLSSLFEQKCPKRFTAMYGKKSN